MKKIISVFLVLALAFGILVGFTDSPILTDVPELEPWTGFADTPDPAGVSSAGDAIEYVSDEQLRQDRPEPLDTEDWTGGWATGGYLNDGGRYPIEAMVSFMDDDCRAETYSVLFREVIEPLELPYTISLPIDKLDADRYITGGELLEMLDAGVSVSCHTMNETSMADHTPGALNEMLTEWMAAAQELGCGEVLSYAYCNGVWDDNVMPAVKAHFRMGFTVESGINQMPYESFYMKRVGLFANKAQAVPVTLRDGTYLNANGTLIGSTPGVRMTCERIPVREGEEYLLTCSAVWKGACYAIYNSSGKVLEKYNVKDTAAGGRLTDYKVRIPAGAAYMIVSHNVATHPDHTLAVKKLPDKSTLYAAKRYVDQVAQEGGWLIFMTHAWYDWFDAEDLKELVDYIRDAGIPIMDVNDAIRATGNVIEVGTFRKPLEYAESPYFVVSAEGRVYTNSLETPDVPEHYENVKLNLSAGKVLYSNRAVHTSDTGYVVSEYVDVSDCEGILVTGWAYNGDPQGNKGYQIYTIKDADGAVLDSYSAENSYGAGGDTLDHVYIELPEGAATVIVAGNIYHTRPALTKVYAEGGT